MDFSRDYLKRLAGIPTPEWENDMENDEKEEQEYDYCQLRNAAKDLLNKPNDKEAQNKISELVKKLEIDIK